ncbi:hypothetical protein PAEPH01_1107 [Pancytospora epiphaga]|nr:hypothetical protein PAEPH01_1107 [Pancytospora epiphaga]
MPIRGFDQFILQRSIQRIPMKVLEDTIIGLDGFWFLKRYLSILNREALFDPSTAIEKCIKPLLAIKNVSILWIWDGLDYAKSNPNREYELTEFAVLEEALKSSEECRGLKNLIDLENLVDITTSILRANGVSVVRAPYSAMAQCVYFLSEKCVSYIFTKSDALLFPQGSKIILGFNPLETTLEIADRARIFEDLEFNLHGFQSFAFLCGCEFCPTIPSHADPAKFLPVEIAGLVINKSLEENLREYYRGIGCDESILNTQSDDNYLWRYYRSFLCVDLHPVMAQSGHVECLAGSGADIPVDFESIFGKVLDDAVYQQLFTCNISPKLLNRFAFEREFSTPVFNEIFTLFKKLYKVALIVGRSAKAENDACFEESWKKGSVPLNKNMESEDGNKVEFNDTEMADIYKCLSEPSTFDTIEKLLKIKFIENTSLNRLLQITVLKLSKMDFDPSHLLCLLNATSSSSMGASMISCDLSKASQGLYYFFMRSSEYIQILKDVVSFVTHLSGVEDNSTTALCFGDMLSPWRKEELEKFLKNNILNAKKLIPMLEVLRKN